QVEVLRLRRESLADAEYRDSCYLRAGLLERVSVAASEGGQQVFLNLYRLEPSGPFSAGEIATIDDLSPLLAALAVKHVSMLGMLLRSRDRGDRLAAIAARLHALDGRLTRRETEVLSRILLGVSSEGISLDLGIGVNTVLTYRKRAYARLGVTSQAELFSLCL
ncbi:MAG: helix-turn-helix transcriptional regulator, partial [Burkholderiales bacterium]|nr:helix-turn-helix transcriptional regulator [Burkholderiales bacterium]